MRYLFITYVRKPNGQIDEQVAYGKTIKQRDLQNCNIIVDYRNRTIEKCVIEGKRVDTDFERLNEYYREVYPSLIEQLERVQELERNVKNGKTDSN